MKSWNANSVRKAIWSRRFIFTTWKLSEEIHLSLSLCHWCVWITEGESMCYTTAEEMGRQCHYMTPGHISTLSGIFNSIYAYCKKKLLSVFWQSIPGVDVLINQDSASLGLLLLWHGIRSDITECQQRQALTDGKKAVHVWGSECARGCISDPDITSPLGLWLQISIKDSTWNSVSEREREQAKSQ